jgi:hypothetical protein
MSAAPWRRVEPDEALVTPGEKGGVHREAPLQAEASTVAATEHQFQIVACDFVSFFSS